MSQDLYTKYAYNVFSQNGEDGIITRILELLHITPTHVCEFGACDGILLSNTFLFVKRYDCKAVYIEGNPEFFKRLQVTASKYTSIVPVHAMVSVDSTSSHSLDNILTANDMPTNFDILSIDVDSNDYQIWQSMTRFKPKIVVIEINSSFPPDSDGHVYEAGKNEGTTFKPMLELALQKGYTFVCHTGNVIFIRSDLSAYLQPYLATDPYANFRYDWINGDAYR